MNERLSKIDQRELKRQLDAVILDAAPERMSLQQLERLSRDVRNQILDAFTNDRPHSFTEKHESTAADAHESLWGQPDD